MRDSQSIVRNASTNDDQIRDSRSFTRQIYDDGARPRDSNSNARLYRSGEEVARDSYSVVRDFNASGLRDGQSVERHNLPSEDDRALEQANVGTVTERTTDAVPPNDEDSGEPNVTQVEDYAVLYTFERALPELEHPDLQIRLRSFKVLDLLQWSGDWTRRMEISGFWRSSEDGKSKPNDFTVIYSSRSWHSAYAIRLIAESSQHSQEIIAALKSTLYTSRVRRYEVSSSERGDDWIAKVSGPRELLGEGLLSLAIFLKSTTLEAGQGTDEQWCIGYFGGKYSARIARDDVLKEKVAGAPRAQSKEENLLLSRLPPRPK